MREPRFAEAERNSVSYRGIYRRCSMQELRYLAGAVRPDPVLRSSYAQTSLLRWPIFEFIARHLGCSKSRAVPSPPEGAAIRDRIVNELDRAHAMTDELDAEEALGVVRGALKIRSYRSGTPANGCEK